MKKILSVLLASILLVSSAFVLSSCAAPDASGIRAAVLAANDKIMAEKKYSFVSEEIVSITENGVTTSFKDAYSYIKATGALVEGANEVTRFNYEQTSSIKIQNAESKGEYKATAVLKKFLDETGKLYYSLEETNEESIKTISKTFSEGVSFESIKENYEKLVMHNVTDYALKNVSKSVVSNETTYIAEVDGNVLNNEFIKVYLGSLGILGEEFSFEQERASVIYVINADGYLVYSFVIVSGTLTITENGVNRTVEFNYQKGSKAIKWGDVTITPVTDVENYLPATPEEE